MVQAMGHVAGFGSGSDLFWVGVRVGWGGWVGSMLGGGGLEWGIWVVSMGSDCGDCGWVVSVLVTGVWLVCVAVVAVCCRSWGSCCRRWVIECIWAPSAWSGAVTSPMAVFSLSFMVVSAVACLSWRLRRSALSVSSCWSRAANSCWKMCRMSEREGRVGWERVGCEEEGWESIDCEEGVVWEVMVGVGRG